MGQKRNILPICGLVSLRGNVVDRSISPPRASHETHARVTLSLFSLYRVFPLHSDSETYPDRERAAAATCAQEGAGAGVVPQACFLPYLLSPTPFPISILLSPIRRRAYSWLSCCTSSFQSHTRNSRLFRQDNVQD